MNLGRASLFSGLWLKLGVGQLWLGQILRDAMEAAALLLLLALCVTSDANFYGNSITITAPKRNKNGTLTVGRTKFLFYYRFQQTHKQAKRIPVLVVLGLV